MKVPCCRVFGAGDISTWGKTFLSSLQKENVIEVTYESDLQKLLAPGASPAPQILFVENGQESRAVIQKLRASGKRFFIVWFGRAFSKEDHIFAWENRCFSVFEHARAEDKKVLEWIRRVSASADNTKQFEHLIHSLKTLLLQGEADESMKPLVTEIKAAVTKLEGCGVQNDLAGVSADGGAIAEAKVPFQHTRDFGDALSTVHDLERTGVLWVRGALPEQEGKVEFLQGKIISAVSGEARGLKGIYRMFLWDEPRFLFTRRDPQDCVLEEHLEQSMKYICLEGEELRQRFEKIRRELPPSELRLELEPSSLHVGAQLSPADFSALASVVEFKKVGQVIDYNPLPDVTLYESLIRLKKGNMIRVAA